MKKIFFIYLALVLNLFAVQIKDAYNDFEISEPAKRVVALDYVSVDILIELDAFDKIVGITDDWKSYLGKDLEEFGYDFSKLPQVGKNKNVNYESIMELKPDVVIVSKKYTDTIDALKKLGLNVFVSSLKDFDGKFREDLAMSVKSLAKLTGKNKNADELLAFIAKSEEILNSKIGSLKDVDKKPRVMMLDKWLGTYGGQNYVSLLFENSGADFFLKDEFNGYKEFGPEAILAFDPDYIFIQSRYKETKEFLQTHESLSNLRAIKEGNLIVLPPYAKAWGHITPEAASIGRIFIGKTLHKDVFKDIDLDGLVSEFNDKFYRHNKTVEVKSKNEGTFKRFIKKFF